MIFEKFCLFSGHAQNETEMVWLEMKFCATYMIVTQQN